MLADELAMQAGQADGLEQLVAVDHRPGRVALRQDLLVVRELAVDQAADEVDAVEVEQDLVAGRRQDDLDRVVRVGEDARSARAATGPGSTTLVSSTGSRIGDRLDRDPVVVGRGEGQLVALELRQDAGQDRPGLVARGREGRLGEGLLQDLLGDPGRRSLAGRRDRRELLGVDALDVGLEMAGLDVERLRAWSSRSTRSLRRQAGHDVGQEPGRHGDRAVRLDLARDPVGDPDLEVRGGQLEAGVLGPEQDVVEDRQRAPGRRRRG